MGPVSDSTSLVQRLLPASEAGGESGVQSGSAPATVFSIDPDVSIGGRTLGSGGSTSDAWARARWPMRPMAVAALVEKRIRITVRMEASGRARECSG